MRKTIWTLIAVSATSIATVACGGDDATSTGGGGSGGSGAGGDDTTASTTKGATTGTSTAATPNTGPGPGSTSTGVQPSTSTGTGECGASLGDSPCGVCADAACCPELEACANDPACVECSGDPSLPSCDANAKYSAFSGCLGSKCTDECGGGLRPPTCGTAPIPSGGSCVGAIEGDPAASKCAGGVGFDLDRLGGKACEECIESTCCSAVEACDADANCKACLTDGTEAACNAVDQALTGALITCAFDDAAPNNCAAQCNTPNVQCNPVTNAGCEADQICSPNLIEDPASGEFFYLGYLCYLGASPGGPPADNACGEACGETEGACKAGAICLGADSPCYQYCCDAGDCGGGECVTIEIFGGAGICLGT